MEVRGNKMRFARLSVGLNPIRQDNTRAPASRGVWAFPFGHHEMFFMAHQYRDILPIRFGRDAINAAYDSEDLELAQRLETDAATWMRKVGRKQVKLHSFWHEGPVYSVIDSRGEVTHDWMSGTGHWNLLEIEQFAKALRRHLSSSAGLGYFYEGSNKAVYPTSSDYLEVFIPGKI